MAGMSMPIAILIFVSAYIFMLVFQKIRPVFALMAAAAFILLGYIPLNGALVSSDINVLLMMAGTMIIVMFFIESKMPLRLAEIILDKVPNVQWGVVALSLFSGFISAFVDNVATVLMVAPVGLAMAKKMKITPVPVLISIAVSSNLQGAATLVGDTTSILLGTHAGMNFLDFFFMEGRPGIFWAVELGALATVPVILFLFRKDKQPIPKQDKTTLTSVFPTVLLVGMVILLITASFLPNMPQTINGIICMALALLGLVWAILKEKNFSSIGRTLGEVDYQTLLLLIGIFIMVKGIEAAGVIKKLSEILAFAAGGNIFGAYTLIVVMSVILSAFIDNIPYVATMLPVVAGIAATMGIAPYLFYFGLLTGATLGGNITPIGASANIAAIGILRKNGHDVSTKDFMRIGIPFTLVAVLGGYVFIWLVWGI